MDTNIQYTQKRCDELSKIDYRNNIIKLSAWKNDKAIIQVPIIAKDTNLNNIKVDISDLKSENSTISKTNVDAYFIKPNKAYNGEFIGFGGKTGPIPKDTGINRSEVSDIILNLEPISINKGKLRALWLEFNIPAEANKGVYNAQIKIISDELLEVVEFNFEIKVFDIILPDSKAFKKYFDIELWQYPYSSAEYYDVEAFSKEHFEILKPLMNKYKKIGGSAITTTISEDAWGGQTYSKNEIHYPSMIKWKKTKDGFKYDYTDFDKWIEFNKGLDIADKIIIYSIYPWHSSFTYWEDEELVYEKFEVSSDRYNRIWSDFLYDLMHHLEEKDWLDNAYIGIDEQGLSHEVFDLIYSIKNSKGQSFKTAGAMDDLVEKYDLALRMTDLNVGDTAAAKNPKEFTRLVKERKDKGYRTTLYSCTGHIPGNFSLCESVESYWTIINSSRETDGFLRWAYDAWIENPLEDTTHNSFEPGDTFLIYPDYKDSQSYKVHSSIRLEKMAEAIRDVNKLRHIKDKAPQLNKDIEKAYEKLKIIPEHRYNLLSDDELQDLISEMSEFKKDIDRISEKFEKTLR